MRRELVVELLQPLREEQNGRLQVGHDALVWTLRGGTTGAIGDCVSVGKGMRGRKRNSGIVKDEERGEGAFAGVWRGREAGTRTQDAVGKN